MAVGIRQCSFERVAVEYSRDERRHNQERKTHRVDINERDTSKAPDQRNELIQIARTSPRNRRAQYHHEEPKHVLLPLDPTTVLARATKDLLTRNLNRRIDL